MSRLITFVTQLVLIGALIVAPAGCTRDADADGTITTLRLGVLPGESRDVLEQRYEPLRLYLEETTGVHYTLVMPDSYESLLNSFLRDEIDVACLGGYTFVAARELSGAVPLVLRSVDRRFVSYCLVPGDSTVESIAELEGSRLGFGSRLSTSGDLMPRYFLHKSGITPETFFGEIVHTGSHDATVRAVADGRLDVGFANAMIVGAMLRDGRLIEGKTRILYETPPYVDYVWAARREVPEQIRDAVVDAFLALDPDREDHRIILRGLNAFAYYPAASEEFDAIASIVESLGMLEELR